MQNLSMSASQEISLLTKAERLKKLIASAGFQQSSRLLTYHCVSDFTPIGMALLGYKVHAVNSDPTHTQRIKRYVDMGTNGLSCDSYPVFEIGKNEDQPFDVVTLDGCVMTELHTDSQLEDVCRQLAATIKPGGLLVITTANFDETLRTKEQILPPLITEDHAGRHVEVIVRHWHGNGYEYTETQYRILHGDEAPTVSYSSYHRRVWRNAELALALTQAGFQDVLWQNDEHYTSVLTAKKT